MSQIDTNAGAVQRPGQRFEAPRLKSGIPRLDFILKGGFIRGDAYCLAGPPGAGKTILSNQFCFNYVKDHPDQSCVYITLLSESIAKMLTHLRAMKFYDPQAVGSRIHYLSAYATLSEHGHKGVLELVQKTHRELKPAILVLDGVDTIDVHLGGDRRAAKEFVLKLQAFTSLTKTTMLLCAVTSGNEPRRAENTLVDGVIELSDKLVGPRAVRELTVHKFRGSDSLRGRHEVEITDEGMQIHPRTEVQFDKPPGTTDNAPRRVGFGVESLDRMLGGGIASGSTAAVIGSPGTGKTTLGLSFLLDGARKGRHGTYFGFNEPPEKLVHKADQLGMPLGRFVREGLIDIVWQPPLEHFMDSLAEAMLERVRSVHKAERRLFVDGLQGFRAAAVYMDRVPRFLSAICNQLRAYDVTTVISETLPLWSTSIDLPTPELPNVCESTVLLRNVELDGRIHRLISVMKMSESAFDADIREFHITSAGVEVGHTFERAETILSGQARRTAGTAPASSRDEA